MSDTYTEFGPLKYNAQEIAQKGYGMANSGPTDDRLIVGFYHKSVLNTHKSKEAGKRICEDREFVKIQHPGETLNILDRPIQEADKFRWPRQWAMFQQGKNQIPDGIPITLLYPDKPSITDMLIGYNIHTVEQLAHLSANGIDQVGMGCQEWVNKAAKYLEQAQKGVDFHRFEQAMQEKDTEMDTLRRQVKDLSAQLGKFMRAGDPRPPDNFDIQTTMQAAVGAQRTEDARKTTRVVNFSQEITSPDLSGEVKRGRGRPRKQKEG